MDLAELPLTVEPMQLAHLAAVMQIEQEAFSLPWPERAYRYELTKNELAHYYVLRPQWSPARAKKVRAWRRFLRKIRCASPPLEPILGYAGFWLMYDEAHISTLAIQPEWRRRGLGELLLVVMLDEARRLGAARATLEVRVSNVAAQGLYSKYGFEQVGRRKAYYSDNREDAFILTTPHLGSPSYQRLVNARRRHLLRRLARILLDKIP